MKKSKIFCLAAVAVLLFTLAACGGYTSKIYDNAQKWIKKDVLESNMTKAPDAEDSDLPKEICRLIDSREKKRRVLFGSARRRRFFQRKDDPVLLYQSIYGAQL